MIPEPTHQDRLEGLIRAYLSDLEHPWIPGGSWPACGRECPRRRNVKHAGRAVRVTTRWLAAAAAVALMIGYAWTFRQNSLRADAVTLVHEASQVLETTALDRAYRIQIDLAPGDAEQSPLLAALAAFDYRLWTRSDRFCIEGRRPGQAWAWGRNGKRNVWVATTAGSGLNFSPEELPEPLDEALDLFTLDLDALLHLLSTEFDVSMLGKAGDATARLTRIRGTPRADRPRRRLRSIIVVIDERTKVVRQVVYLGLGTAERSRRCRSASTRPRACPTLCTSSRIISSRAPRCLALTGDCNGGAAHSFFRFTSSQRRRT